MPGLGLPKPISSVQSTTPTIENFPIPSKDTEYSYTLPANTVTFTIQSRNGPLLKLAYTVGQSATEFISVSHGWSEYNLNPDTTRILYFQSIVDNDVLEIVSWSST